MGERLVLLDAAERAGWPRLQVGRLVVGPGEVGWRQRVTLAEPAELEALARAVEARPEGEGAGQSPGPHAKTRAPLDFLCVRPRLNGNAGSVRWR